MAAFHQKLAAGLVTLALPVGSALYRTDGSPAENCERGTFTSFASDELGPKATHWDGPVFELQQQYPDSLPIENPPWLQLGFDDSTGAPLDPERYLLSLLDYGLQSAADVGIEAFPATSSVRTAATTSDVWFHVPWQDYGVLGREFVHGFTNERVEPAGSLGGGDDTNLASAQTWSVGLYNDIGGFAIGQVWCDPTAPDLGVLVTEEGAGFPNGAFAIKYLFTTASPEHVTQLESSPTFTAHICRAPMLGCASDDRVLRDVRLIQVDVAARDRRSPIGWLFGTFRYTNSIIEPRPLERLLPVGLMWGNSPGGDLDQQWTNPEGTWDGWQPFAGHNGLLVGPVDDRTSSCASCHSTAGSPPAALTPPVGVDSRRWFENIPSGEPFVANQTSADYSLQLSSSIHNFRQAHTSSTRRFVAATAIGATCVLLAGSLAIKLFDGRQRRRFQGRSVTPRGASG